MVNHSFKIIEKRKLINVHQKPDHVQVYSLVGVQLSFTISKCSSSCSHV